MAKCSDHKNPLQREGTARGERLLPGLQNGYVTVDEKSFADWIVFAKEFAPYLHYYELNGAQSGDWGPFFSNDISAVLGTIAIQDVDAYKRSIKERFDFLKNDDHVTLLSAAERKLNDLFSAAISFCEALDEFDRLLPAGAAMKTRIENMIQASLAPALNRLLRYYKAAKDLGYLQTGDFANWKVLGSPVKDIALVVEGNGLGKLWWKQLPAPVSWKDYFDNYIAKDESIFGDPALDIYFNSLYLPTTAYTPAEWLQYMKMNHAANHNLFAGVFNQFLMNFSKLVMDAEKELLLSLENNNTHPAHYALFLAFLRLFRLAQNDINTITQRHLDFYYKEVLQLQLRAALPNSTHILAELAKPVDSYLLAKDTLFKAGKDSEGKEVLYGLNEEETFNKAKVKSLRSVYIGTGKDNHPSLANPLVVVNNEGRMFAAPMINSGDGVEADLISPNKEWHPIANRLYSEGEVMDIKMPAAEIGFAVASHYLYLQEGSRKVMLRLATDNDAALVGKQYAFYFTAEKEWYKVPLTVPTSDAPVIDVTMNNAMNNGTEPCIEFSFTLTGDMPPVTNYNVDVHGGTLNVKVPVVKIMLLNDEGNPYEYNALRNISISKLEVAVEVGLETPGYNQQGLKQLLASTDGGPVDTSKPFQPFGGQPRKDATLVIGNKELFTKKNASVKLNIEWGGLPAYFDINYNTTYVSSKQSDNTYKFYDTRSHLPYYPKVKPQFLIDGSWSDQNNDNTLIAAVDIFYYSESKIDIFPTPQKVNSRAITDYFAGKYAYGADSVNGFMRLVLEEDFGHKKYLSDLTAYLIQKNNSIYYPRDVGVLPVEPYTPILQSIYISYAAYSDVIDLSSTTEPAFHQKEAAFFHLYPFGDAEQHGYLSKQTSHYLLPQFRHADKDLKPVLHEGEFYIGFENLAAQQSVNVLFQVMDGTADPKISKPTGHIIWSYLSNNQWLDFLPQQISDATMQLIQSGIISFAIPADATTANSLMPADYLWIKASVAEKTDSICKLLSVDAQAAVATFTDHTNAADFLNAALPAATISKLKIPQSAVKKVTQPYSSFGGRALESSGAFYTRVSERLRHKSRAITIWDYEHLVLEAFPLIHKVKCLNHTKSLDADYNEVMPGHVTIITIPDLRLRNDINPLKPYTSQSMLQSIDAFLRNKISCHVQLHVVNPDFEEVKLKFNVKLTKGYDDFTVYAAKLKEEITAFLSPWAYSESAEINFGGKVYKSVLINFIEERPYVDFITNVEMCHFATDGSVIKIDNDEIIASTGKSILVSVPASRHEIEQIKSIASNEQYECDFIKEKKKGKLLNDKQLNHGGK